jgi:hypothetical protein
MLANRFGTSPAGALITCASADRAESRANTLKCATAALAAFSFSIRRVSKTSAGMPYMSTIIGTDGSYRKASPVTCALNVAATEIAKSAATREPPSCRFAMTSLSIAPLSPSRLRQRCPAKPYSWLALLLQSTPSTGMTSILNSNGLQSLLHTKWFGDRHPAKRFLRGKARLLIFVSGRSKSVPLAAVKVTLSSSALAVGTTYRDTSTCSPPAGTCLQQLQLH